MVAEIRPQWEAGSLPDKQWEDGAKQVWGGTELRSNTIPFPIPVQYLSISQGVWSQATGTHSSFLQPERNLLDEHTRAFRD